MNCVFLGAPGSGKGTQAALLVERFGVWHLSTGDLFRQAVADQTILGKQAHSYLSAGLLVPDDIVLGIIDQVLEGLSARKGFILDGFPRTLKQAEKLEQPLDAVISFEVPEEILVQRMLKRKRADETQEIIRKRLAVFHEQTAPLRAFYRARGLLKEIDASQPVERVFETLAPMFMSKITSWLKKADI